MESFSFEHNPLLTNINDLNTAHQIDQKRAIANELAEQGQVVPEEMKLTPEESVFPTESQLYSDEEIKQDNERFFQRPGLYDRKMRLEAGAELKDALNSSFGENLRTAFYFGSLANDGKQLTEEPSHSDLDTFIIVKEENPLQTEEYRVRLKEIHTKLNLKSDEKYPFELISEARLQSILNQPTEYNLQHLTAEQRDDIFFTQILAGNKEFSTGDAELLKEVTEKCKQLERRLIQGFISQILDMLQVDPKTFDIEKLTDYTAIWKLINPFPKDV